MTQNRLKKSLSLDIDEYAVSRGIDEEPIFKWWVPCNLRRRDRIIASVNKRIIRVTHQHGVEVLNSVSYAKKLDEKNGNTPWIAVKTGK